LFFRLRPDQRMMENGEWDIANTEKVRLEEKQRAARKDREIEAEELSLQGRCGFILQTLILFNIGYYFFFLFCRTQEPYLPLWFHKVVDEQNGGRLIHVYKGGYWEAKQKQSWETCPDIF